MKSILLSDREGMLEFVYSEKVINRLVDIAELDKTFYTSSDIRNGNNFADTEYIFSTWGMPVFTTEEVKCFFPNLKAVFYAAGSVQYFAREFLNCGVKVFSAWAANAVPVAEYTVAQIILANKGFFPISARMSKGEHSKSLELFQQFRGNFGNSVGIIGAGMIGKLVINMLKNYDLNVLVFDPFLPDDKADELGVKKVSLEELFSNCQVVSNHLADNPQTRGMLNKQLFEKLPQNATFLNTGRGAQVVEADLIKVLENRPDLTAILDVTNPEPPTLDSQFYKLSNCILTPHIAGSSGNEVNRMAQYMADEFLKLVNKEQTNYEVTLEMLKTMA